MIQIPFSKLYWKAFNRDGHIRAVLSFTDIFPPKVGEVVLVVGPENTNPLRSRPGHTGLVRFISKINPSDDSNYWYVVCLVLYDVPADI